MAKLSEAQESAIDHVLATSDWAIGHVRQVRRVASWLFEALRERHGFGDDEEILLQAGALLHDVGYPIGPADHHKVSARIVRARLGAPFAPSQIELIALLARYHRKGLPKLRHRRYGALDDHSRRVVVWLGGILRVADGLDRAHDSGVEWLGKAIVDERLEIRVSDRRPTPSGRRSSATLVADAPPRLAVDLEGAMRKRDLLERAVGMPVIIRLA